MRRIHPFYAAAALLIAAVLALLLFFVRMMSIRSAYKGLCLEVNDAILSADPASCTVEQGGQVWPASEALLNCYDQYFLLPRVWPLHREQAEANEQSIILRLDTGVLTLTDLGEGDVNLRWETDARSRGFTFNAGPAAFRKLESFLNTAGVQS